MIEPVKPTIYHNSRCSKSRQTLALLEGQGIVPTVIYYLETPPSAQQLNDLLTKLNVPATDLIRFKETLASEIGIAKTDSRSTEQWCELLAQHPSLIERPIVINGDRAAIGRPPENVLGLFE